MHAYFPLPHHPNCIQSHLIIAGAIVFVFSSLAVPSIAILVLNILVILANTTVNFVKNP
jgi:hypothetical protein